jgi:hypothetical protein
MLYLYVFRNVEGLLAVMADPYVISQNHGIDLSHLSHLPHSCLWFSLDGRIDVQFPKNYGCNLPHLQHLMLFSTRNYLYLPIFLILFLL